MTSPNSEWMLECFQKFSLGCLNTILPTYERFVLSWMSLFGIDQLSSVGVITILSFSHPCAPANCNRLTVHGDMIVPTGPCSSILFFTLTKVFFPLQWRPFSFSEVKLKLQPRVVSIAIGNAAVLLHLGGPGNVSSQTVLRGNNIKLTSNTSCSPI